MDGIERENSWSQAAVITAEATRAGQMGKIFGYTKGLHAVHLIHIGVQLGLFHHLAKEGGGLMPEALASILGLHPPYVQLWCETACGLELLDFDPQSGYRLAPYMDELLGQPQGTFYLGGFPDAHLQLTRDYAQYPERFRTGQSGSYQEHDEDFMLSVAGATQTLPRMFLDAVLPKLPALQARLEGGATLLDVGCGAGSAIVEIATRYPKVRCVGIDAEPMSIGMAQQLIRDRGLGDRVEARLADGSALPPEFTGAFDLVTTFLVLHEIDPKRKAAAVAEWARVLQPDGWLLLFDERYPSTVAELRDPIQIFAVMAQWYELTWGNRLGTREEIQGLLADQGLRVVDETVLSRFYIVTAQKS